MWLDGAPLALARAYNSRVAVLSCFTGFYADVTAALGGAAAGAPRQLDVWVPPGLAPGAFQGVFFENVVTEYTDALLAP